MAGRSKVSWRGELDKDRVARAALSIADKHGIEGFTIRAVADSLGVSPMALYHHVPDKAALAALMVDAAIREMPMAPLTGDWREDLWELARWARANRYAHPAVGDLRRAFRVWTPTMLAMAERWLAVWRESGLSAEQATFAAAVSSQVIGGLVDEEFILRDLDMPGEAMLSALPNARTLLTARFDPDAKYEFAVRTFNEALHQRLARGEKPPARKRGRKQTAARKGKT